MTRCEVEVSSHGRESFDLSSYIIFVYQILGHIVIFFNCRFWKFHCLQNFRFDSEPVRLSEIRTNDIKKDDGLTSKRGLDNKVEP